MKRILSILMAVAMVACLLPTAAIATGEAFSVSVVAQNGDLTGVKAGETVTATVKLPVDTQIGGSTIQLTYDSNYFTVTSATSDFLPDDSPEMCSSSRKCIKRAPRST